MLSCKQILVLRPKPDFPDHAQISTVPLLQNEAMAIQAKNQKHRVRRSLQLHFSGGKNKANEVV